MIFFFKYENFKKIQIWPEILKTQNGKSYISNTNYKKYLNLFILDLFIFWVCLFSGFGLSFCRVSGAYLAMPRDRTL